MSFSAFLNNAIKFVRFWHIMFSEKRNIKRKKYLYERITLSHEQKKEIDTFFRKHYGKKISTNWHKLYTSYTGQFQYNYFPEYLFSSRLEPKLNPYEKAHFLGDKNLLPIFFKNCKDLHVPLTIISCVNSRLRDENNCIISNKEATDILSFCEKCVIKKTIDTNSGKDVEIIHPKQINISKKLKEYGDNFVVQELIKPSKDLSELYPHSINTFRVITYFCKGNLFACPVALRIGRSNADRDNIHYGGIVVGVDEKGFLKETAFSEFGERFTAHPDTKVIFNHFRIKNAGQELRDAAKVLHSHIPFLGIISWDLTIDSEDRITVIEMNTLGQSAWFPQMVNGESLFGDNTSYMLEMIRV